MARMAFDKYDEPVNIDIDPEEGLKVLLQQTPPICEAEETD